MPVRAVACQLNGSVHMLRLDLGAMAALEDRGISVEAIVDKLAGEAFSPKSMQLILWAMLQGEEEPPTLKAIGSLVDGENFNAVAERIGEALRLAFPEKNPKAPPDPLAGAGTGALPSASPSDRSP